MIELALAGPPQVVVTDEWKETIERAHYSPAVRVGDLVILSGVLARVPDHNVGGPAPTEDEMRAAFTASMQAIGRILEAAGTDWDHVAEIQTFHTDMPGQIGVFGEVKDRFIKAPYPAWTAIDIDRMGPADAITEIKITAVAKD
jgi:enamine deaminase RidA (YjgF/YER057c/UK114 family)